MQNESVEQRMQIVVQGSVLWSDEFMRALIEAIEDEVDESRDAIVIRSRPEGPQDG